jgi:hypothetical protein
MSPGTRVLLGARLVIYDARFVPMATDRKSGGYASNLGDWYHT